MIRRVFITFILLLANLFVYAQGDTLQLSIEDIDENQMLISNASAANYWKFQTGHHPDWKNPKLDDSDWASITPATLTLDMVDDTGKLEGWFRLKFKLDAALDSLPLLLHVSDYGQALDIFLDGKRLHTHGQLGTDSTDFQGAVMSDSYTFVPIQPEADSVHTIAIHYMHMPIGFPANLNEVDGNLRFGFWLVTYDNLVSRENYRLQTLGFSAFSATATVVITLLFWLFFLYNRRDKLILLISLSVTGLFLLQAVQLFTVGSFPVSMSLSNLMGQISGWSVTLIMGSLPFIFAIIFTGSVPRFLWVVIPLVMVPTVAPMTGMNGPWFPIFTFLLFTFILSICLYYLIKSWKVLKGAQWAIVIGVLLFLFTTFTLVVINYYYTDNNFLSAFENFVLQNIPILLIPFSLLVYVVIRFGESQEAVKNNAAQLVKVTEEKRQLALDQQVVLEKQVKERTEELSQSLSHLKNTQAQLIQSEKMASLGELTAGIAHEIQNPLNFVNNFSDVSGELLEEMEEELASTTLSEQQLDDVKEIIGDLKQNLEKIHHHGGRADSIVKGMLQHSQTSSGEKEPTDINELADEYLRLAYHGLRAKDPTFNAAMETNFDDSIGKIKIIPQDIGRVLLNLITNAFQATHEKSQNGIEDYQPKVTLSTLRLFGHRNLGEGDNDSSTQLPIAIGINISDNGPGIPDSIKDKIFQPFFTTKPTGQGTGLGLSLAYDIIKSHGGELKVESEEGKGTKFTILIPS